MIVISVCFFLGVISLYCFSTLPSLGLTLGIASGVAAIAYGFFKKNKTVFKALISFLIGFLWVFSHALWVVNHQIPVAIEGKPIEVRGIVDSIPETKDDTTQFEFNIQETLPKSLWPHPGRVKLRIKAGQLPIVVGDQLALTVKLKRPHGYQNPGSFDLEKQFFANRLVAQGMVVQKARYERLAASVFSHPIDKMRLALREKINKVMRDNPYTGIMNALSIGVQSGITSAQWTVLKDTGTAHLVAIAGLHMAFVTGFFILVFGYLFRHLPVYAFKRPLKITLAKLGILVSFLYALFAGFSIPTQRAFIMITLFMLSIILKRQLSPWRAYCLALLLILIINPLSTLTAGFWLSFGAVGFILYGMQGYLRKEGVWFKWGRIQWVLFLGLTPITLVFFGSTSVVSFIANLIAVPYVGFLVLPFCLLGTLSIAFNQTLGALFFKIAGFSLSFLWPLLNELAHLSFASIAQPVISLWPIMLALIGVLILLLPKGVPGRMLGVIFFLPLILIKPDSIPEKTAKITVLDVGQGLSTVVETAHHVLVFDTGPKLNAGFDTGDRVVLPFLAMRRIKNIDILMISHGDNDHAGGARSILEQIPVKTIMTSEPKLFPEFNTLSCQKDQSWEWDGVMFYVLHPSVRFTQKRNDHSCVLKVSAGEKSVLLTADIESKSEKMLMEETDPKRLSACVLLVPHHGSKTSSTIDFIRAVNPAVAVVSTGYLNQYGHPKKEVMARYESENIPVFDTAKGGAISFTLNAAESNDSVKMHAYRFENQRYWHSHLTRVK